MRRNFKPVNHDRSLNSNKKNKLTKKNLKFRENIARTAASQFLSPFVSRQATTN